MMITPFVGNLIWCLVLGSFTGAAELVSRYRENLIVLARKPSILYISVNGLVAALVFWLIHTFNLIQGASGDQLSALQVMAASFGGIALLRTNFVVAQQGTENVYVGPHKLVSTILKAVDREVDRNYAVDRIQQAKEIASRTTLAEIAGNLPLLVTSTLQTADPEEVATLRVSIEEIRTNADLNDEQKKVLIVLLLSSLAGHSLVDQVVKKA